MLTLNYKEYGSGKPLIVLHGLLGSLDNWHTLATEWGKQGLHVYTLDLRNHGRSPHTEHHSTKLMVDDLKDFMDQRGLTKASLLGHSMGGKVVMQFAVNHPSLVDKLIVADMAPRAYRPGAHDDVFNAIFNVDLTKAHTRKEVEEAMSVYLGDFGTRQFVMKGLDRLDEGKYKWKFNVQTLFHDYPDILPEVSATASFNGPVLFIKGGNSLYIQEKDMPLIKKLYPSAVVHTIDQAGHWLHADNPSAFFEEVKNFLI